MGLTKIKRNNAAGYWTQKKQLQHVLDTLNKQIQRTCETQETKTARRDESDLFC